MSGLIDPEDASRTFRNLEIPNNLEKNSEKNSKKVSVRNRSKNL